MIHLPSRKRSKTTRLLEDPTSLSLLLPLVHFVKMRH